MRATSFQQPLCSVSVSKARSLLSREEYKNDRKFGVCSPFALGAKRPDNSSARMCYSFSTFLLKNYRLEFTGFSLTMNTRLRDPISCLPLVERGGISYYLVFTFSAEYFLRGFANGYDQPKMSLLKDNRLGLPVGTVQSCAELFLLS